MAERYCLHEPLLLELDPSGATIAVAATLRLRFQVSPDLSDLLVALHRAGPRGHSPRSAHEQSALEHLFALRVVHLVGAAAPVSWTPPRITQTEWAFLRLSQVGGCFSPASNVSPTEPPRWKARSSEAPVPLPSGDAADSFSEVVRRRRSTRSGPERCLPLQTIGTLLDLTCREADRGTNEFGPWSRRPAASGGALHPIETLVCARRVDGLEDGVYHYNPTAHHIQEISGTRHRAAAILQDTARAAPGGILRPLPAAALLFLLHPGKTARKYTLSAVSVALRDLGCLLQQAHLSATALGLTGSPFTVGQPDNLSSLITLDDPRFSPAAGVWLW